MGLPSSRASQQPGPIVQVVPRLGFLGPGLSSMVWWCFFVARSSSPWSSPVPNRNYVRGPSPELSAATQGQVPINYGRPSEWMKPTIIVGKYSSSTLLCTVYATGVVYFPWRAPHMKNRLDFFLPLPPLHRAAFIPLDE